MLHLFIYGTDDLYQVIAMETTTSLTEAFTIAEEMSRTMRDVSVVSARKGLKSDFMEAIHGGFDDKIAFMDMLKRESLWK